MSLGEIIWLALIVVYTIYQIPSANGIYEILGMLIGGIILGILPIYIGRKLEQRKAFEDNKNRR